MDVLSGETTINVSRVKHEYITTFPSFTICTRHELNSTQLKNGTLNQFPLEMELQINATVWNPKEQQINMMNGRHECPSGMYWDMDACMCFMEAKCKLYCGDGMALHPQYDCNCVTVEEVEQLYDHELDENC